MTGPVGMQSMNVGLEEASQLAAFFSAVLHRRQSQQRLVQYGQERLAQWRQLLGVAGGLRASDGTDPWVAPKAPLLLPCLPASGSELERLARQLGLQPAWNGATILTTGMA